MRWHCYYIHFLRDPFTTFPVHFYAIRIVERRWCTLNSAVNHRCGAVKVYYTRFSIITLWETQKYGIHCEKVRKCCIINLNDLCRCGEVFKQKKITTFLKRNERGHAKRRHADSCVCSFDDYKYSLQLVDKNTGHVIVLNFCNKTALACRTQNAEIVSLKWKYLLFSSSSSELWTSRSVCSVSSVKQSKLLTMS